LVQYGYILSILPTGAKLFSEVWLILPENRKFMPLSFLFDQTGRPPPAGKLFRPEAALNSDFWHQSTIFCQLTSDICLILPDTPGPDLTLYESGK
jgi:hypothetical protein